MDIRKKYNEETGKYYYTESMDFEWSTEYVEWLEKKAESITYRLVCPECWSHNVKEVKLCHCDNCGLDYKR